MTDRTTTAQGCRLTTSVAAGHVMAQADWDVVRFPAMAEDDEIWALDSELGQYLFTRQRGEALHPERQPVANGASPVWIPGSIWRRQSLRWLVDSEWQSRHVAHFNISALP